MTKCFERTKKGMEGNKEEALRAFELAKKYFNEGDLQKAQKLCQKSIHLYSTIQAHQLSELIKQRLQNGERSPKNNFERPLRESNGNDNSDKSDSETSSSTEMIEKINKAKDFYEVLGVSKNATVEEITKRYRKLALQLHPDKNKATGAEDAFKKVSNAFATLKDPEKRKMYDLQGTDEPIGAGATRFTRRNNFNFEADITPEELFAAFFGIPVQRQGRTFTRMYTSNGEPFFTQQSRRRPTYYYYENSSTQRPRQAREEEGIGFTWYIPLLIMIMVYLLFPSYSDPGFRLQSHDPYVVERISSRFKIPFYVTSDFEQQYSSTMRKEIDVQAEQEWIKWKQDVCRSEQQQRQKILLRARYYGSSTPEGQAFQEQAKNFPTPSCDVLRGKGISPSF